MRRQVVPRAPAQRRVRFVAPEAGPQHAIELCDRHLIGLGEIEPFGDTIPVGRVVRRLLGMNERGMVHREEHDYGKRLQKQSPAGEIELFGDN